MKKLILLLSIFLVSCTDSKIRYVGNRVIDGKVSATKKGAEGRSPTFPIIYVQTPTETKEVVIPFKYEGRWKVGDSCLIIIEKYKEICDESVCTFRISIKT